MTAPLFNFDDDVNIHRSPIADGRTTPSGIAWDKTTDAPISGATPAARNASATGAMAAAPKMSGRAKSLVLWFHDKGRLTLDEARTLLSLPVNCVTGPWRRIEQLGWIVGTGEYFTYTSTLGRPIRREYHRLTPEGQHVARELTRQREGRR
jgi:hypothetical protein